jgi:hypothetical protein
MTTASPASLPNWPHKAHPALALGEGAHIGTVQLLVSRPTLAGIRDLCSANGMSARRLLTVRYDSAPLDGCWMRTTASDSVPGAIAEPVRAWPGPTEAPQALASGVTTGSPRTKRDYAAHDGTVAMTVVSAYCPALMPVSWAA